MVIKLMCSFIPILLLLDSSIQPLAAQTVVYQGKVVDACSGVPLQGVTVRFLGNSPGLTPGAFTETTDANGEFTSLLFGYQTWLVTAGALQGVTTPAQYFFSASQGNQNGVNFSLLPSAWEVTINGAPISISNSAFNPLLLCTDVINCINISGSFGEFSETPLSYCFRGRVYRTDASGNKLGLLAESPCLEIGDDSEGIPPCEEGLDLRQVLSEIEDIPSGGLLALIEVEQFCCSPECQPTIREVTNTQDFFVRIDQPLEFDFEFVADSVIEHLNASTPGNANLTDNLVPRTETLPGTLVGPFSISFILSPGLDASRVDGYQLTIEEVSCSDGATQVVLYDETIDEADYPAGGFNPNLEQVGPAGQEQLGYFFLNSGGSGQPSTTDGKCYKVTIVADSDCGEVEQFSYFRLAQPSDDPNCPFCLVSNNPSSNAAIPVERLQARVFPMPTNGLITVEAELPNELPVQLELSDLNGRRLQDWHHSTPSIGLNTYRLDLSNYPSGMYLLTIASGSERIVHKVIKR